MRNRAKRTLEEIFDGVYAFFVLVRIPAELFKCSRAAEGCAASI
jgi:hypothetical protein